MQLWVHGNTAYLVSAKVCIRISSYLFLSDTPEKPLQLKPTHNAAVHVKSRSLIHAVASDSEAECGALFHHAQLALPIKVILQ